MGIGERIKNRRKQLGMTAEQLAEAVGKSPATIYRYENGGINRVDSDKLLPIADVLHTTPAYLMGWDEKDPSTRSRPAIRIPVLGTIPAGIPLEAIEDVLDWEEAPASWADSGSEFFGLLVHGDSMYPEYRDGDVVIFRRQDTCESGDDCAVMVNGDDATFKRVKLSDHGLVLQPINPAYDPLIFTPSQIRSLPVRILGIVVELRRKI